MSKIITQVIGLAVIAVVFTTSLAAQSAFMPNERSNEQRMQLRADKKAWPEYQISYGSWGDMRFKNVYEYDAAGNRTLTEQYRWENSDWVIGTKTVAEYDAAGNQTLSQGYAWANDSWVNSYKMIFDCDAEGNVILDEYYYWRDDSWVGNNKTVYEYTDGERSKTLSYGWGDGDWELRSTRGAFELRPSYLIDGGYIYFGFPHRVGSSYTIWRSEYDEMNLDIEYDENGNLTLLSIYGNANSIKYDENNNFVSIEAGYGDFVGTKITYDYDAAGRQTLFEYSYIDNDDEWVHAEKQVFAYDSDGNRTYYRFQQSGYSYSYVYKYDDNGNEVASYYYDIIDGDMILGAYSISYPNNYEPEVYITNITEIGESNEGSFDITTSMSIDSIQSGSLVVFLPKGFSLDEEKTALASGLADKYDLNISRPTGSPYVIDVAFKANTSNNGAGKILRIAYKVDEELVRGTYDIEINQVLFNTPGGDFLPSPATIVPAIVNRWGVSNEAINSATPKAYTTNNTLYIYVAQTERIAVYSLTGIKLYEATVSAGTTTINTSAFPQGVLIVKGNSGWAKKVVND